MARGRPTAADEKLADAVESYGFKRPSAATFEYWRSQGALPARLSPGLGQGRGRGSQDPPEAELLAVGIARFLDKRRGLPERADLPRRRRVAEAPLWLWYEGYPIPTTSIASTVAALYTATAEFFAAERHKAAGDEPEAAAYELPAAAADAVVARMDRSELFRKQLRALRDRPEPLAHHSPNSLASAASSQLLQALQGDTEVEAGVFAAGIEFPLMTSTGVGAISSADEQQAIAKRLSIDNILRTVDELSEEDWRDIRASLHAIQGNLIAFAASANPQLRAFARASLMLNNATRLAAAAGAMAVNLDVLREELHVPDPNTSEAVKG
jgi:hypothetical protein